jgi:5'-deoxynucleotidase
MENENQAFFAILSRMKYINRWGLMRNTRPENLCEHSYEVAVLSHALCELSNARFGGAARQRPGGAAQSLS